MLSHQPLKVKHKSYLGTNCQCVKLPPYTQVYYADYNEESLSLLKIYLSIYYLTIWWTYLSNGFVILIILCRMDCSFPRLTQCLQQGMQSRGQVKDGQS